MSGLGFKFKWAVLKEVSGSPRDSHCVTDPLWWPPGPSARHAAPVPRASRRYSSSPPGALRCALTSQVVYPDRSKPAWPSCSPAHPGRPAHALLCQCPRLVLQPQKVLEGSRPHRWDLQELWSSGRRGPRIQGGAEALGLGPELQREMAQAPPSGCSAPRVGRRRLSTWGLRPAARTDAWAGLSPRVGSDPWPARPPALPSRRGAPGWSAPPLHAHRK